MTGQARAYAVVVVAAALLASAGCSSPYESGSEPKAAAGDRTIRPMEGCGDTSWTDPADLSPNRPPARPPAAGPARLPHSPSPRPAS